MTESSARPAQGIFEFEDAEFWSEKQVSPQQKSMLLDLDPGLYLDGPRNASTAQHETIPHVGARVTHGVAHLAVSLSGKATLLMTRHEDRFVAVGPAYNGRMSQAVIPVRSPASIDTESVTAELFEIDSSMRLGLPLEAGTWSGWVLLFDQASNSVTTHVRGREIVDPEVLALVEQEGTQLYAGPAMPPPGDPMPDYVSGPLSPRVPLATGLSLNAPRVTVMRENASMTVRGSFRLPIVPSERVHPELLAQERQRRSEALPGTSFGPPYDAIVRIHLLLIGNTHSWPQLLRLAVPGCIEARASGMEGPDMAVGFFSLNLRQHLELEPQTYALWSVAAGELRGPVLAALVAPETLTPPRR